ncbi:hypothetical protein HOK51_08010 [Candidatus Woesearchaeota archaeon]|jgi:hypothetical protein|nr:hypothetical protein [Candidatus Woesearchaeota archaeon]MBT6519770.1 hypothetical protein [Candidatus Woesearchaeota archaeon]MBT7368149.1 hypothetical protein [Candidatus Woesearchaeota archaeon]
MNQALALKKLKGIKPKGVKVRDQTKFEQLFNLAKIVMSGFNQVKPNKFLDITFKQNFDVVYDQVKSVSDFSKNDLETFVLSLSGDIEDHSENTFSDIYFDDNKKYVLGLFTGALLTVLTKRNIKQNKKTIINIDGNNQRFDYLFAGARQVDQLVLKNFKGEGIGQHLAAFDGCANLVKFSNLKGNSILFRSAYGGNMDILHVEEIKGDTCIYGVASNKGSANLVIAKNIEGSLVGAHLANDGGKVKLLLIEDVLGDEILGGLYSQYLDKTFIDLVISRRVGKKILEDSHPFKGLTYKLASDLLYFEDSDPTEIENMKWARFFHASTRSCDFIISTACNNASLDLDFFGFLENNNLNIYSSKFGRGDLIEEYYGYFYGKSSDMSRFKSKLKQKNIPELLSVINTIKGNDYEFLLNQANKIKQIVKYNK